MSVDSLNELSLDFGGTPKKVFGDVKDCGEISADNSDRHVYMCIDKPDLAADVTLFPARSSLDDWGMLIYNSDTVRVRVRALVQP